MKVSRLLVLTLALSFAGTASAETFWLGGMNWGWSAVPHIWVADTTADTMTSIGDVTSTAYTAQALLSLEDTGAWLYAGLDTDSTAHQLAKIDRSTGAVVSSVAASDLNAGITGALTGMTYDGTTLWAMNYDGVCYAIALDGSGDPTGATAGIDILASGNGSGWLGSLSSEPGNYVGAYVGQRYVFQASDLTSATPTGPTDYAGYDYQGGAAFDSSGQWYIARGNGADLWLADPDVKNGVSGAAMSVAVLGAALGSEGLTNWGGMSPVVVVPEPATMALLGMGGLMLVRRRRRA